VRPLWRDATLLRMPETGRGRGRSRAAPGAAGTCPGGGLQGGTPAAGACPGDGRAGRDVDGGTQGAGAHRARRAGRLRLEGGGRRGRGAGGGRRGRGADDGREGEGRRREVPAAGEEADRLGAGG
jgi:hypothetical protein